MKPTTKNPKGAAAKGANIKGVTSKDVLTITGAPAGWPARKLVTKLLVALRKAGELEKRPAAISVSFVSGTEMRRLNQKYRGKNKVTDVLSFEVDRHQTGPVCFLGDLVICVSVVRTQAKDVGNRVTDELAVLLCHGLLHLLGYDHEKSPKESRRMAVAESKVLSAVCGERTQGLIKRVEA